MGVKTKSPSPSQNSFKLGDVDGQLTDRALRALLKHHESSGADKEQLLGNDLDIQVQFTLGRIPGNPSPKPIRIDLPHPLVKVPSMNDEDDDDDDNNLQDVEVCLIVKESSKPWIQDLISKFPIQLGCIKKVLGLQSLRTKHKSFTQKRELLAKYDVFMADDRILPMLTKALGSKFFEKKKQPIPIRLTREEALPFAVQKCLRGTFMYLGSGTCLTVKAGNTAMSPSKILANIVSITSEVPTKVPRKWSNVRSISIKTSSSVALPIYNKTPEELEQLVKMAKEDEKNNVENVEEEGTKKRKAAASTPLSKVLKKQKAAEEVADVVVEKSAKKSSKKKKKEPVVEEVAEETAVVTTKTPKSSKKKKVVEEETTVTKTPSSKKSKKETAVKEETTKTPKSKSSKKKRKEENPAEDEEENAVANVTKTPKSTKKKKSSDESSTKKSSSDDKFIPSRKFSGAKKGYVFTKSMLGTGYYKDVLPVIDQGLIASMSKKSGGGRSGGGGGRKSMGQGTKKRKAGGSRRSY